MPSGRYKLVAGTASRAIALLAVLLLLAPFFASASKIHVIDPVDQQISRSEPTMLDIGIVGPGQKIEIVAARNAGETSIIRPPNEAVWDKLIVVKDTLPRGWTGVDSLLYEDPMKAFVILDKNAPDGQYVFEITTLNSYEEVKPLTFKVKARVSRDVLEANISKTVIRSGAGQPAIYLFTLTNKGSASDVFEISVSEGLPGIWRYTKEVFVPHGSKATARYEVVSEERGEFQITFNVKSLSSQAISVNKKASLLTESSLLEDMKSSSHGLLLFPSIAQIIYSLLGLVANVIG